MTDNLIITIGRQYGTGGREIGRKLAGKLGIKFLDRELIARAAKKSGFSEELFDQLDKRATNSFLYSLTMFGSTGLNGMSLTDQLYLAQAKVIREAAEAGPCVIVGRCADYALREFNNCVNIFVYADLPHRIRRISNLYHKSARAAEETIIRTDKRRSSYYNYYTGKKWGAMENYDLAINTSRIGVDHAVQLIADFAEMQKNWEPIG